MQNSLDCRSSKKPLVSLTDESDTLARLGFVAVGTPVLSLGSVGSVVLVQDHHAVFVFNLSIK